MLEYVNSTFVLAICIVLEGFPNSSVGKESACNAGDLGLFCGLGRSLGEGKSYPLQYFCLENSMDRRAWQSIGSQRVRHDRATNIFTLFDSEANSPVYLTAF